MMISQLLDQGYWWRVAWHLRPRYIDGSEPDWRVLFSASPCHVHGYASDPDACPACFAREAYLRGFDLGVLQSDEGVVKVVGRGKTKTVYASDECTVIKTGPVDRISKQARRLRRLARVGVPVAKILASGDGWLAQDRGTELLADRDRATQAEVLSLIRRACAKAGYRVHDMHSKNVMLVGGTWSLVDCGATRRVK